MTRAFRTITADQAPGEGLETLSRIAHLGGWDVCFLTRLRPSGDTETYLGIECSAVEWRLLLHTAGLADPAPPAATPELAP